MNFKFNKLKPEFAALNNALYENSIYDIIGQLIAETVYKKDLDKDREIVTGRIFVKKFTHPTH